MVLSCIKDRPQDLVKVSKIMKKKSSHQNAHNMSKSNSNNIHNDSKGTNESDIDEISDAINNNNNIVELVNHNKISETECEFKCAVKEYKLFMQEIAAEWLHNLNESFKIEFLYQTDDFIKVVPKVKRTSLIHKQGPKLQILDIFSDFDNEKCQMGLADSCDSDFTYFKKASNKFAENFRNMALKKENRTEMCIRKMNKRNKKCDKVKLYNINAHDLNRSSDQLSITECYKLTNSSCLGLQKRVQNWQSVLFQQQKQKYLQSIRKTKGAKGTNKVKGYGKSFNSSANIMNDMKVIKADKLYIKNEDKDEDEIMKYHFNKFNNDNTLGLLPLVEKCDMSTQTEDFDTSFPKLLSITDKNETITTLATTQQQQPVGKSILHLLSAHNSEENNVTSDDLEYWHDIVLDMMVTMPTTTSSNDKIDNIQEEYELVELCQTTPTNLPMLKDMEKDGEFLLMEFIDAE